MRDECDGSLLFEATIFLDDLQERLPPEELHHHVGGVVLLEEREDFDDARVLELGQPLALGEKLVLFLPIFQMGNHPTRLNRCSISRAALDLRKEFLDRNRSFQSGVTAKIGDSESSLSQDFSDGIQIALQPRTDRQSEG